MSVVIFSVIELVFQNNDNRKISKNDDKLQIL